MTDVPPKIPNLRFYAVAGRGGMSVVWRAWHTEMKRVVAVKVLDRNFAASGQDVRQFMMEVRAMSRLDHPGIVKAYEADVVDGHYYMIMDYVDGYTFGSLLARKRRIAQTDALIICESVANAMKYAWETFGIVHCDIKPDNLMIDRDGTVKITDMGLCRTTAAMRGGTKSDEVIGTPAYISPEQIYGDVQLDCRADIYCLGATLYHLSTGRMLFPLKSNDDILRSHVDPRHQAPDPCSLVPSISPNFSRLLAGMMVKEREMRYQNWDEVYEDANNVDNGDVELAPIPDGVISSCLAS